MSDKTLGGHLYYVKFIDDHPRKSWLYLLKTKDEVFDKFKEFRVEVETLTKKKIKTLRFDNGGEYTSEELISYCKDVGIKRKHVVPYYPEQNGLAKRKNRSIEEGIRTMLLDQDLLKFLWGEAAMIAVYVQNRSPHKSLDNTTPEEVFTRKNPSVDHFRIFGSPAYVHVLKDKRKKLDSTSIKGIFIGYSLFSKAYRIDINEGRYIEASRDVIFDENQAYKKSKDIPIDSDDEEDEVHENSTPNDEEEGPSELIQSVVIPTTRKRPYCLRATLEDAEGHEAAKGSSRESKKSKRYSGYAAYMTKLIEAEPSAFQEAEHEEVWKKVMQEEYQSIMRNRVWEIVPRSSDKSIATSECIYKIKHAVDGSMDKYKARFVARGFSQKEGIDYEETFAPTTRYTTIRSLVSLAATMGWNIVKWMLRLHF